MSKLSVAETAPFSFGSCKGTAYEFKADGVVGLAYEFALSGRRVGLVYTLPAGDARGLKLCEASARSLKAVPKWDPLASPAIATPEATGDASVDAALRTIAGKVDWWHVNTGRYVMITNLRKESAFPKAVGAHLDRRTWQEDLEVHMDRMLKPLAQEHDPHDIEEQPAFADRLPKRVEPAVGDSEEC